MEKNNPKIIRAWTMFDWANSSYNLVITSTIFPIYYNQATREAFKGDIVQFLGFRMDNTVIYSYSIAFAFLIVAMLSPLLSGIADFGGRKKAFMQFFTYLGGFACIALWFFMGNNVEFGISASILACIGYASGIVFYNAFLHDIATPDQYDSVSAKGFSMGYIGSVILFVFNLILVLKKEWFGITGGEAARISFVSTGLWWIGFAQIMFNGVPEEKSAFKFEKSMIKRGYQELFKVYNQLKTLPNTQRYLLAFFLYNTGVQTVMLLAATFGEKEMKLVSDELIATILVLQLIAVVGAHLFAWISKKQGNKFAITVMLFIWIGTCLFAYFIRTATEFYGLAVIIGLIMGGIQSMSRSTYAKLIPQDTHDSASFFSFYDVMEKLSIVLGTATFALVEQVSGNMRNSTLVLTIFFVFGLLALRTVKIKAKE